MSESVTFDELLAEVNVPPHMINLWTKKFPIFSPQRNKNGKIFFKTRDLAFAKGLKHLLIHQKETINSVQTLLNQKGFAYIADIGKNPDNYKLNNSALFSSGINFSPAAFVKNTTNNIVSSNKDIAKKAISSLNHIFSGDKKQTSSLSHESQIPLNNTPNTDTLKTNPIDIQQKSVSLVKNNTTLPVPAQITDTELPPTNNPIHTYITDNNDNGNFEENWRNLMEKNGKAVPIKHVRNKTNTLGHDTSDDIWFIDDEINLFEEEPMIDIQNLKTIHQNSKKNIHQSQKISDTPYEKHYISHKISEPQGLTIEQTEKIKHLIAKLDIMRDELISANVTINQTLKAFGFSSFDNAYTKFDQKSVY